ncbi:MAG: hypothetical protein JWN52_6382, partial [Actinomycetia bacterium]|nr:hypothetical protein [Actinomycetes bacterium]
MPESESNVPEVPRQGPTVLAPTRTESFWLVRLYRRLMPRALRSRVARLVAPEVRNRVILRAAAGGPLRRLRNKIAHMWLRTRHPMLIQGRILVREGGRIRIAVAGDDISPLQVRRTTLDLVCDALTAGAVPFFCVRSFEDTGSTVAVSAADRDRAIDALEAACTPAAAYVGPASGDTDEQRAGLGPRAWKAVAGMPVIRIVQYHCSPQGSLMLGRPYGCSVEFWKPQGEELVAPRPNRMATSIPLNGEIVAVPEEAFTRLAPAAASARQYPTRSEFIGTLVDDVPFPVDVVYTWVDGSDAAWQIRRDTALGVVDAGTLNEQAANDARYISRDELRYSLRSLAMYAPWVRHIWIVTDSQVPVWLDISHPKVTVVDHKEIFGDRGALPTFNSHAIESQLHHIDGLAEHFLYFNDDVFLGRPVIPGDFFLSNGMTKFFLSKAQVSLSQRSVADMPVLAAGKNNRKLIEETFGHVLIQKMKHVPSPLRRSLLAEIEERFPEESAETARHQFR